MGDAAQRREVQRVEGLLQRVIKRRHAQVHLQGDHLSVTLCPRECCRIYPCANIYWPTSIACLVLIHFDLAPALVRCMMSTSRDGSDHEEVQAKDVFTVDMGSAIREAEDKVRRLEAELSNVAAEEKHVGPEIPAIFNKYIKASFP